MNGELTVRKADWDSLNREERHVIAFGYDGYPDLWTFQGEESAELFVAERNGCPAGAMWGYRLPNQLPIVETTPFNRDLIEMQAARPGSWFICGFAVRGERRGDKSLPFDVTQIFYDPEVGAALLTAAEVSAQEEGPGALSCVVPVTRRGYHEMFETAGFTAADERIGYHSLGESITWRLMVKAVQHG